MIKVIKFLFTGRWCNHKWKILERVKVFPEYESEKPIFFEYHLQCEKCGEIIISK